MAGLSHCLKKIGLSKHEAAILKGDAKEYVGSWLLNKVIQGGRSPDPIRALRYLDEQAGWTQPLTQAPQLAIQYNILNMQAEHIPSYLEQLERIDPEIREFVEGQVKQQGDQPSYKLRVPLPPRTGGRG